MLEKQFDHKKIEPKIYALWEHAGYFKPENLPSADKETYTILMPPPNANAPLHCGHATYAIQDLMVRFKRMQGYKVLYVPGTDHAGFETQVVYERKLKKEGKSRFDFDAQTLYSAIYNFVLENSDVAISQLKKIGMSADWDRNLFMLDDIVLDTVYNTFKKMHEDGLIYRDSYMVNYSPHHGTTFSNLETEHVEQITSLYYVSYKLADGSGELTVATTRPETIYADVAVAVNPKDKKYKGLVGKKLLNPLDGRELLVIEDSYVDMEFGTGALKITPGHDFTDYEIGQRHGLKAISLLTLEGKMNENAGELAGLTVKKARVRAVELLTERGALQKIDEKYKHALLVDYKDKLPIEPMLLPNWFVKMDELAKNAVNTIQENKVKFNQATWKNQMLQWLENIKDWPISRQIVFGIRIPVWYAVDKNPELYIVFIDKNGVSHEGTIRELLKDNKFELAEIKNGLQKLITPAEVVYEVSKESPGEQYIQETDTFDTWFSSGQWPLTTLKYPDGTDFKAFFPTNFMDSMWDILFFWIARMIMFSLYLTGEVPYKNVYIHGRINDAQGRKMSKSLGNVIDPLEFIEKYGADALRMNILVGGNTAAKNTSFSEDKARGYRNFANKIWNMARFMLLMLEDAGVKKYDDLAPYSEELAPKLTSADKEILKKYTALAKFVTTSLENYKFKAAGDEIYHFMWDELADNYIENVKTREGDDKLIALAVLRHIFLMCLKLLHPFMPFVTEEIWQNIPGLFEKDLIISKWPQE